MAKNDLKPNQLSSSDDEEEEEEASGSEDEQASGSDSDDASDTDSGEKPKPEPKKALTAPPPAPPPQSIIKPNPSDLSTSYETEDSGSISETDSDSDLPPKRSSAAVGSTVKPISSVPMERVGRNLDSKLVKKDGSKTVTTPSPAKSKRPPPAPLQVEKDAKKAKQNPANGDVRKSLASSSQSVNKSQAPDLSVSETEESESGSETDTDSDSPPVKSVAADLNVKPISSKPMEPVESKSVKKTGSKTVSTPVKSTAKSKPLPAPALITCEKEKDVKKGKKGGGPDEDSKKQLFQRLWSEDDEIVILEGMIDYKNETGVNPIADMGAFHEFIKKSLHVDVSRTQLADKVRRLKKKYVNNASREKDGKDRSFSKSHEQRGYELSKLIWGGNGNNNSKSNTSGIESKKKNLSQKNGKFKGTAATTSTGTGTGSAASLLISNGVDGKDKVMMDVEKTLDISRFVRYGGMGDSLVLSEEIVKAGLELVDGSKRAELEAKWRKLKEEELMLYVKRMELLKEQALVVLEAVRSSGN